MPPWRRHPHIHANIPNLVGGAALAVSPPSYDQHHQFCRDVLCPDGASGPAFPIDNAVSALFFPKKKAGSSQACVKRGTLYCGTDQGVVRLRRQSVVFSSIQKFRKRPSLSDDFYSIEAGKRRLPKKQHLLRGTVSSIFWRFSGLRQIPPLRWRRDCPASGAPFLLDYEPSVWHSYGCSPFPSLGLLLSGNSSFTDLGRVNNLLEHYI